MKDLSAYIESLETGEAMPEAAWREWIEKEQADFSAQDERFQRLETSEIDFIVDTLKKDGFVLWYAVQESPEDPWDDGTYDREKALQMLKNLGCGLVAVINEQNKICVDEISYSDI